MTREAYEAQVALLVRLLPHVAKKEVFALKGGTAINLFYRDLPRLSVDIDLTYLPIKERAESLAEINEEVGDNIVQSQFPLNAAAKFVTVESQQHGDSAWHTGLLASLTAPASASRN